MTTFAARLDVQTLVYASWYALPLSLIVGIGFMQPWVRKNSASWTRVGSRTTSCSALGVPEAGLLGGAPFSLSC